VAEPPFCHLIEPRKKDRILLKEGFFILQISLNSSLLFSFRVNPFRVNPSPHLWRDFQLEKREDRVGLHHIMLSKPKRYSLLSKIVTTIPKVLKSPFYKGGDSLSKNGNN
jgi:hypothetical protein